MESNSIFYGLHFSAEYYDSVDHPGFKLVFQEMMQHVIWWSHS